MIRMEKEIPEVIYCQDPYDVAENTDGLIVCTEWDEFKTLDFNKILKKMNRPYILDGRNMYNKEELETLGFEYQGIGR